MLTEPQWRRQVSPLREAPPGADDPSAGTTLWGHQEPGLVLRDSFPPQRRYR